MSQVANTAPTDFSALKQRLNELPGPIIGHNLFNFDYLILRRHLNLEHIVEKSADTLHFLYEQDGGGEEGFLYSLDLLAKENFGEGKTTKASTIPKLLKEGKLAEVLAYNERDCDLTFRVWWKMVSERHISAGEAWDDEGSFEVTYDLEDKDISVLTCTTPRFTYTAWVKQFERDGWIVMPPREQRRREKERERQRVEAWEAARGRDQAMREFIKLHLRDDIPHKFAPKWGMYDPDAPLGPLDVGEAQALLERAGLPGSVWAEEVICRLLRGNYTCPARLELVGCPDDPEVRAELIKGILVALADDGYIPCYHVSYKPDSYEPDDDSISLAGPPPRPHTFAEEKMTSEQTPEQIKAWGDAMRKEATDEMHKKGIEITPETFSTFFEENYQLPCTPEQAVTWLSAPIAESSQPGDCRFCNGKGTVQATYQMEGEWGAPYICHACMRDQRGYTWEEIPETIMDVYRLGEA